MIQREVVEPRPINPRNMREDSVCEDSVRVRRSVHDERAKSAGQSRGAVRMSVGSAFTQPRQNL